MRRYRLARPRARGCTHRRRAVAGTAAASDGTSADTSADGLGAANRHTADTPADGTTTFGAERSAGDGSDAAATDGHDAVRAPDPADDGGTTHDGHDASAAATTVRGRRPVPDRPRRREESTMTCWFCATSAKGVCRFCGRGVCENHARFAPYLLEVARSNVRARTEALVVDDALTCGSCRPVPQPVPLPELD